MKITYTAIAPYRSAGWVKLEAEKRPGVECSVMTLDTIEAIFGVCRLIRGELRQSDHDLPISDGDIAPYIGGIVADALTALESGTPMDAYSLTTEGDTRVFERIIARVFNS